MSPLQTSQVTFIMTAGAGRELNPPWFMFGVCGIPAGTELLHDLLSSSMECRNVLSLLLLLIIQKVTFFSVRQ